MGNLFRVSGPAKGSVNRPAKSTAALAAAGLSLLFVAVYGSCNWITAQRSEVAVWYYAWERFIPFVPVMIIPYMSIDLFFIAAPFACRSRAELRTLVQRIVFAILVAGAFFVLVPLQLAVERPQPTGWPGIIFSYLHGFDQPHNLFPSLHITLCTLLAELYLRRTQEVTRVLTQVWFSLIGISTLLTYQHHFADVVGGLALAVVCLHLFREQPERQPVTPNHRVGSYYVGGALLVAVATGLATPWTAILWWPVLALLLTAAAYFGLGPSVYRKCDGVLPLSTRWIFAPCLFGQYLSLLYYRRKSSPWDAILPNVWIGRKLGRAEATEARRLGLTAALDLTTEFSESAELRKTNYLNIPILDLTAPTGAQLREAVSFISHHCQRGGIVLVHCKAGFSRSAAIVGAYLLSSGQARTVKQALELLQASRPSIILRPEVELALEAQNMMPSRTDSSFGRTNTRRRFAFQFPALPANVQSRSPGD